MRRAWIIAAATAATLAGCYGAGQTPSALEQADAQQAGSALGGREAPGSAPALTEAERLEREAATIEAATGAASGAVTVFAPQPFGVIAGGIIGVVGGFFAARAREKAKRINPAPAPGTPGSAGGGR
jgi:hypothetical protein